MIINAIVMTVPSTNREWLNELMAILLKLAPLVQITITGGVAEEEATRHSVSRRRYATLKNIPPHITHVMWIDPDDLIDSDEFKQAVELLQEHDVVGLREGKMTECGTYTETEGVFRGKAIIKVDVAKRLASKVYRKGGSDLEFRNAISEIDHVVTANVVYKHRQHDKQLSKDNK